MQENEFRYQIARTKVQLSALHIAVQALLKSANNKQLIAHDIRIIADIVLASMQQTTAPDPAIEMLEGIISEYLQLLENPSPST